jgi:hypothetical protein
MFGRDRRTEKRLPSIIRIATISARPKMFACSVENISRRGAKIRIPEEWILSAWFSLVGSKDLHDTLGCRLIWRKGDYVGVRLSQRLD